MLNIASDEWGVQLPMNPLDKVWFPVPSRPRQRRLAEGEHDALITNAKESGSRYLAPLIILAVETGMRAGEMLKLRWCDWHADAKVLRILCRSKRGKPKFIAKHLQTWLRKVGI